MTLPFMGKRRGLNPNRAGKGGARPWRGRAARPAIRPVCRKVVECIETIVDECR